MGCVVFSATLCSAVSVLLTLALGIGATTAVFSVVEVGHFASGRCHRGPGTNCFCRVCAPIGDGKNY